ncbi:hypothetical protein INT45_005400 [Circinella minor]|uniref:Uncharacterized protein n=1 Tax=Circinella minor TaxID=1195481 RepID=A0A8H7VBL2_9FUNG|nr:hypothetical protein INT45_005400 [Circinella minor]
MIAPITGKFPGGYAYWQLYHLPNIARRDAYYAKLEASKSQ